MIYGIERIVMIEFIAIHEHFALFKHGSGAGFQPADWGGHLMRCIRLCSLRLSASGFLSSYVCSPIDRSSINNQLWLLRPGFLFAWLSEYLHQACAPLGLLLWLGLYHGALPHADACAPLGLIFFKMQLSIIKLPRPNSEGVQCA